MYDKIIGRIKSLKGQMEENIPWINLEIRAMIKRRDQRIHNIEELLDILLNFGYLGVGEKEFKKLNSYYASFNPTNAKSYADSYKEHNEE